MSESAPRSPAVAAFRARHYAVLATAILTLALFNFAFRLGSEIVTEWDESLYAVSAAEMLHNGNWIATTSFGALDYYNAKPPLNVWFLALTFKAFGGSLVSLRLVSVVSAWLTVAVVMLWTRRIVGPIVSLLAGFILATTFGFIYVHSARSGNPDALFTLLIVLCAVTLAASRTKPWLRIWFGPLLAAAFMLKGMGMLMPAAIVGVVELLRTRDERPRLKPWLVAGALFAIPVATWAVARWQIDGPAFFKVLFGYDFIARTVSVIEDHPGSWFYYLDVLQRNHYDWLIAGAAAVLLVPRARVWIVERLRSWRRDDRVLICGTWMGLTLLIPTLMQTKLPWYLNEFYPVFAIGTACLIVRGLMRVPAVSSVRGRQIALGVVVVIAGAVAESKLIWYSFEHRDLAHSVQGLILGERDQLVGQRVFREHWSQAETFVLSELVGAERHEVPTLDAFMTESCAGDYLVASATIDRPELELISTGESDRLYRRRE